MHKNKHMKFLSAVFLGLVMLVACNTSTNNKNGLYGQWEMDQIIAGNDTLTANQIGSPIMTFTNGGVYAIDFAGVREFGKYTLTENELTLQDTINDVPAKTLTLISKTADKIVYETGEEGNVSRVTLLKKEKK